MKSMIDVIAAMLQYLYFLCSPVFNPLFIYIYKYYEATILGLTVSLVGSIITFFVDNKRKEKISALLAFTFLFGAMAFWMNPDTGGFYDMYVFSEQYYDQVKTERKQIEALSDRITKFNKELDACKENIGKYDKLFNESRYNGYIMIYNNYVNMYNELSELLNQLESEKKARAAELNRLINESPINTTNIANLFVIAQ